MGRNTSNWGLRNGVSLRGVDRDQAGGQLPLIDRALYNLRELNRMQGWDVMGRRGAGALCRAQAHPQETRSRYAPLAEVQALMSKTGRRNKSLASSSVCTRHSASTSATKPSMRTFMHIPEGSSARNSSAPAQSHKTRKPRAAAKTGADIAGHHPHCRASEGC